MSTPSAIDAQVLVPCRDLGASIAFYTDTLGFRLDMIMPADAPRVAVVSLGGLALRLERADSRHAPPPPTLRLSGDARWLAGFDHRDIEAPDGVRILLETDTPRPAMRRDAGDEGAGPVITRASEGAAAAGRAGMQYRDLIPGRLGGRYIASHIAIPDGGPVPDYVHYHRVRFQMIYCLRGWVRVVYEDQGAPFVMHAGDCVLQPPTIRHRVLEASAGLEVLEIGGPAEHETFREHTFDLPTQNLEPEREFSGQRFVRHVAQDARWEDCEASGFRFRDTGIAMATNDMASVRVLRATAERLPATWRSRVDERRLRFLAVLDGSITLQTDAPGAYALDAGDTCVIPPGTHVTLRSNTPCEVLDAVLPSSLQDD